MAQYRIEYVNRGIGRKIALVVAVALAIAAAIALVVVSLGLALILIPVVAIGLAIGRWRLKSLMAEAEKRRKAADRTIEIDYHVVGEDEERR
jgi:Flp pilus assembly protein TadB